jgi:integrase
MGRERNQGDSSSPPRSVTVRERGIRLRKNQRTESIQLTFNYRGVECRETLRLAHTDKNVRYAVRLRGEIINAIEHGTFRYQDYFPSSRRARVFGGGDASVVSHK